ncbi:MAG: AMIN domain-containing protein, partial [Myxococcota bacterium]
MALSFLGAVVLATAVACASGTISAPQVQPDLATDTHRLTGVRVDSGDSGSIVTLSGLEDPVYTAFLHSEPWALVLDLKSVEIATENDLVMVYDGLIENVTVSTYGGGVGESLTRVEIALAQDASYEIVSTPDGLLAVVSGSGAMAADDLQTPAADEMAMNPEAPSEFEEDPWSDPQAEEIQVPENEAVIAAAPVQAPAAPATALTGIDYSETSSGVLIHLEADGSIQAMETFRLSAPDRLVVDLPGLSSQVDQATFSLATPQVSQVRVGAHPDKVRVVIDGGEGAGGFKERRIMPANDGLYLALGTGPDLVAALAAAMTTGSMP